MSETHEGYLIPMDARLKSFEPISQKVSFHGTTLTAVSHIAVIESQFNLDLFDRLHDPSFLATERLTASGESAYIILEVLFAEPKHFEMPTISPDVPVLLRRELLTRIDESWVREEMGDKWINIRAVPTGYLMRREGNRWVFERRRFSPMVGSRVHILSSRAVEDFLCVQDGIEIGQIQGFDIPLSIDLEKLVRYHAGMFGFTGTGKSNLTSFLIRRVLDFLPEIRVFIMDISGEYISNLLDLFIDPEFPTWIFSTEDFENNASRLMESQAIPETLWTLFEENNLQLEDIFPLVLEGSSIRTFSSQDFDYTIQFLIDILRSQESSSYYSVAIRGALVRLQNLLSSSNIEPLTPIRVLEEDQKRSLLEILEYLLSNISEKSSLSRQILLLREECINPPPLPTNRTTINEIVNQIFESRLTVFYAPEPYDARKIVSSIINRLLYLKKSRGYRTPVLFVLDEAQEYIPYNVRKEDFTAASSESVERLLRQGRKYRAHCWLATQRVAHLNTNAIQQLHSYFVSVLPRTYDRAVISDAFSIDYSFLERVAYLETGQWLFVSYVASRQKNVPIFIKTPNNEEIIVSNVRQVLRSRYRS